VADSADSGRSALSRSLEGVDKAQSQSNLYFGFAILVGVLLDAGLYLRDMLTGNPDAWRMLWVHGLCAGGLLLSTLLALRNQRRASVNVFQLTAILSIAGHALFAGYGLAAPTLGYLAMFVLSEGFNQSGFQKIRQLTLLSVATVALVALLQLFTPPDLQPAFQREAPLHHQLIAALLLPCVALLVGQATLMTSERIATLGKDMVLEQSTLVAQLRKAMAARNHFFSAVSHEIRTPLTGITTAVALLKHPKTQPEAKARYLDAIEKSTTSLGLLINDVLDISRLESGSFTLAVVRFDLHALLNEVVEFFAPVARTHGNELGWQAVGAAAGASPLEIMADPQRIKQVLSNLIANANKFTTSGRISVELEGLPGPETFRMWKISVLDTGAGIEPGALDSLFSPFVQADNQQHAKGVGTGLGLAIVAALARQMNGDVGVSSTPGEGSRFWFTFRSA
jgi:signal transduction histidine kinase